MAGLITQGFRSTNILVAMAKGGKRQTNDEIENNYRAWAAERGSPVPTTHIRNGLHRLSSDCAVFKDEHRTLDLLANPKPGIWHARDEHWQNILNFANANKDDLISDPLAGISYPWEGELPDKITSNQIGSYAQKKVMEYGKTHKGWSVLDRSGPNCWDFLFIEPGRRSVPRIGESKGSTFSVDKATFTLTQNEMDVLTKENGLLALVFNIRSARGQPVGGSDPIFVDPFTFTRISILDKAVGGKGIRAKLDTSLRL